MGRYFTKLRLFSTKSPSSTRFSIFCEVLYAGRVKPLAEASELCIHVAFKLVVVVSKTASSEVFPSGRQKCVSLRVPKRDCKEEEGG
jgi:hypothetical protein